MVKLKQILLEIQGNTFQMYHGGQKWLSTPEIRPTKGRYEGGPGIYFTNNYETAKKYAKGSNVVQLVTIDKSFKNLNDVTVELTEIIKFLNSISIKNKKQIISDLQRVSDRTGKQSISLSILNNLIVNWEAGSGEAGKAIADFFKTNGADAIIDEQSGDEFWLIVFNPKIIINYTVTKPNDIDVENYMLPTLN